MKDKNDKKDDVKIEKADVLVEAIKEKETILQKLNAGIAEMSKKLQIAQTAREQAVGAYNALLEIQKAQDADVSEES